MALGDFTRRLLGSRQPQSTLAETGVHRSAPISTEVAPNDTDPDRSAAVDTDVDQWQPIIIGTVHSAKERATLLIQALVDAGLEGKSVYEGDLCEFHRRLCEERAWAILNWGSMLRALGPKGLNLRLKGKFSSEMGRLTMYAIRKPPPNPDAAVVELAAVERKRA